MNPPPGSTDPERFATVSIDNRHAPLPVDLGLDRGSRVLDRISVDEALSEPLAGDLVGADARVLAA